MARLRHSLVGLRRNNALLSTTYFILFSKFVEFEDMKRLTDKLGRCLDLPAIKFFACHPDAFPKPAHKIRGSDVRLHFP